MDSTARTYGEWLRWGRERLRAALRSEGETPDLDASVLLAHAAGLTRSALYARLPDAAPAAAASAYESLVAGREGGVPVAYIVGEREFLGLPFAVSPATLVPRPETELLVEWAVAWCAAHPQARLAVDVGTGSGAVAVGLAHLVPALTVIACDLSQEALGVAATNAARHAGGRVRFVRGDLLAWLGRPVPLVLANLPYLTDRQSDSPELAAEPRLALAGGDGDGFALYRRLIPQAAARLAPGGAFAFEIDPAQAAVARETCAAFPASVITVHRDYAALPRFVTVETSRYTDPRFAPRRGTRVAL